MFRFFTVFLLSILLFAGCETTFHTTSHSDLQRPPRPARISHIALFKLNNPATARSLILDCDLLLATIPGVASYACGKPGDFGRSSVDGNYDVGLYVGFDTDEAYANYVESPNHKALVEAWKPRLQWLRVHDVVDDSP